MSNLWHEENPFERFLLKVLLLACQFQEIEPFKIPIRKMKIKNLILCKKFSLLSPDNNPKSGFKNEYSESNIEIIPKNKYRYCSDINSTIEAPKITPGNPKIKICLATEISFFRDLRFLNDPPSPNATVANL